MVRACAEDRHRRQIAKGGYAVNITKSKESRKTEKKTGKITETQWED